MDRPLSHRLAGGRHRRGGLGGLARAHGTPRVAGPDRGRRPPRHQPAVHRTCYRGGRRERGAHQTQPNRNADRDDRSDRSRDRRGLGGDDQPSLGRDRGHNDRRPGRRDGDGPAQVGSALALRARRQVQPACPDRGGTRRIGALRRPWRPGGRPTHGSAGMSRFVDRGAIIAAFVGIGMAVTMAIGFLLIIPIEPIYLLLAVPGGMVIGYYANTRSARSRGQWRRLLPNALLAGAVTALSLAVLLLGVKGLFFFADTGYPDFNRVDANGVQVGETCRSGADCVYRRYLAAEP